VAHLELSKYLLYFSASTIFAKAEWLVNFSQREGLKYKENYPLTDKENYPLTEVNQPDGMQKLSKNLYFLLKK